MANEVYDVERDTDDFVPALDDVLQQPVENIPPLKIEGSVHAHILPSTCGVAQSYTVGTDPVILLGQDKRRRRATIIAATNAILVGTRDACDQGYAAQWPVGVPLVIEHTEQVYVQAATATAVVSVIAENWAD